MGSRHRQRQTIESTGAATHLIHQYQTLGGGMVKYLSGFCHLNHKGGTPAGQVIGSTDAGKNPINQAYSCLAGRDRAADMSEQNYKSCLAHVSRFTAHIGAGNNQQSSLWIEFQIIGDKGISADFFYDGMPTFLYLNAHFLCQFGALVTQALSSLGQVGQYVYFCNRLGGLHQRSEVCGYQLYKLFVEFFLSFQSTGFR